MSSTSSVLRARTSSTHESELEAYDELEATREVRPTTRPRLPRSRPARGGHRPGASARLGLLAAAPGVRRHGQGRLGDGHRGRGRCRVTRRQPAHQHGVLVPAPAADRPEAPARPGATWPASGCRSATDRAAALAGRAPTRLRRRRRRLLEPRASVTVGNRTSIPSDGLRWFGPPSEETPELMAFMRKVYDPHVRRSDKGRLRRHAAADRPRRGRVGQEGPQRTPPPRPARCSLPRGPQLRGRGPHRHGPDRRPERLSVGRPAVRHLAGQVDEGQGRLPALLREDQGDPRTPAVRRRAQRQGGGVPRAVHGPATSRRPATATTRTAWPSTSARARARAV